MVRQLALDVGQHAFFRWDAEGLWVVPSADAPTIAVPAELISNGG